MTKAKIAQELIAELAPYIHSVMDESGSMKQVIVAAYMPDEIGREVETMYFDQDDTPRHVVVSITASILTHWERAIELPLGYIIRVKLQNGDCHTVAVDAEKW